MQEHSVVLARRMALFMLHDRVISLSDLALHALANALTDPATGLRCYAQVGALAAMPTQEAQLLLHAAAERLASSAGVSPPIELLRCFYGGSVERLKQEGASDEWLSETMGTGGLRRLSHLSLSSSRLSAYGFAHVAIALPSLRELRVIQCRGLTAACIAQIGRLEQLERLMVTECELALSEASEVEPLARLPRLASLDLGGNQIQRTAALALCDALSTRANARDSGGTACHELRELRLWGSPVGDDVAAAAGALEGLRVLELGWSQVGGEGVQCIALGLGTSLVELSLARCGALRPAEVGACLPALSGLRRLDLAGLQLAEDDLAAVALLPELLKLGLEDSRLECSAAAAATHLAGCAHLHTLCVDGLTPGKAPPPRSGRAAAPLALRSEAPMRVLRASGAAALLSVGLPWSAARGTLQTLQLNGCPGALRPLVDESDDGKGKRRALLPVLTTLGVAAADVDDALFAAAARACPALTALDASDNPSLGDVGVAALGALRGTLQELRLERLPRLTPHSLPVLSQLDALHSLRLDGTSVPPAQQDALPLHRAAAKRISHGRAALASLADAQAAAAAAEPPPRYDADAMQALRASPFASCPTKPLPQLPLAKAKPSQTGSPRPRSASGGSPGGRGGRQSKPR